MLIIIDRKSATPIYIQIYEQIISSIKKGTHPPGSRLPSLRQNATHLNLSINTVEQAYRLLVSEGYVEARPKSGFIVNRYHPPNDFQHSASRVSQELERLAQVRDAVSRKTTLRYDFTSGDFDPQNYPTTQWLACTREVLYGEDSKEACCYSDPQGYLRLREQLSEKVCQEKGKFISPDQILIMPTTRSAIASLLHLFDPEHDAVAMEEPGFIEARETFIYHGYTVKPFLRHKPKESLYATLDAIKPKIIYSTPANHYPTNAIMSLDERKELIAWAQENDAYILEDDYCHEFRYNTDPLPSLQMLDVCGRVISLRTFSKSLSPATCIEYAILPPRLMVKWLLGANFHSQVSWQMQATLAEFIAQGSWDKHLRRVQTSSRLKYEAILAALHSSVGSKIRILDYQIGLHILLAPKDDRPEKELIALAEEAGVKVYPTSCYWMSNPPPDWNYVLLGYSKINLSDITEGIRRLANAWFDEK